MKLDTARCWAEIDLSALEHNYRAIRARLPEGCRFLGVVKADAYGHGALPAAGKLAELGADYLAVAGLDEAEELRAGGVSLPVLILGRTDPAFTPRLAELEVTQTVASLADAQAMSAALAGHGRVKVHLKLDTGMGRLGFRADREEELAEASRAMALPGLVPEGVFTHFAVSDELPGGRVYTREQFARFTAGVRFLEETSGKTFAIRHCANSGAVLHYPEYALDMARPGLLLYGLYPDPHPDGLELRPVMAVKARVCAVRHYAAGDTVSYGRTFRAEKPMTGAVIAMGYADGLHRVLSGRFSMLIHGRPAPQIGRICMDMCMVDITNIPEVRPGDVATVFGQDGAAFQPVEALAEAAGTISYELVCAMSRRVPRIYR